MDTNPDTVNGYSYTAQTGVSVEPKLVMWGLSTSETGYHIDTSVSGGNVGKENNGVLLIIRMSDNSLFFYDGGIMAQMSDAESAELLAFCRELTGTPAGEKMVINTWFVSHAHDDHFEAFGRFININHKHFDLKNVVYNIDLERGDVTDIGGKGTTPASKDLREALNVITAHYPDVKYYKPHTGETFNVAGIEFEVLYTHEDRLVPASNGSLSFHQDTLSDSKIDIIDRYGTYRSNVYKNSSTQQTDFNDTSTVIRASFENGVTATFYGDLNLADKIVREIHPASALKTDIMLFPHHLFDAHTELAKASDSKAYLISQGKPAVYGIDNNYTTPNATDKTCRDSLRNNFAAMVDGLSAMGRTEGRDYDVFWGGSETVTIDINALGALLGKAASRAAAVGSYYTVEQANSFTYTGWSMTTTAAGKFQSSVISSGDYLSAEKSNAVSVSNTQAVFTPHGDGYFVQEGRYLLMNVAYGHIMSFDAAAAPEVAPGEQHGTSVTGSIKLDADGNSENTYYIDQNGNVILDNSDRHFVLWNMRQYKEATGGTSLANGANLVASSDRTFGGSAIFQGIELQKRTETQNPYWYLKDLGEGADYQLRHFCFKSDSTCFKNPYRNSLQTTNNTVYGDQSGSRVKFIVDSLGDGTYLIYFRENATDYRVVSCDENGNWDVVRYKGSTAVSDMKRDFAKLRIRLYEYKESDEVKKVAFSGNREYQVPQNADVTGILNDIGMSITVYDAAHRNQHIPYDGSEVTKTNIYGTEYPLTKKVGYYWLGGAAVNTAVPGRYPVAIKYRSDNGKDTTIGEVCVIVGENFITMDSNTGVVMKNSSLTSKVEKNIDNQVVHATFLLNGEAKVITVGMLTDANGNPVNTATPGTYTGLTLTYQGSVICDDYTLVVLESNEVLDYPVYPAPGSVSVNKGTTTTEDAFSGTGVAHIELSATAMPLEKGVDVIVIVDLSSSMRYHVNNSEYACGPKYSTDGTSLNLNKPSDFTTEKDQKQYVFNSEWWGNTRLAAMEKALSDMINTLASSGTDVQIAIADFGDLDHYEFRDAVLDNTIGLPASSKPYLNSNGDTTGTLEYEFSNHLNFVLGRDDTEMECNSSPKLSQPYWIDQTKHNQDYVKTYGSSLKYTYTGKLLPKIFTGNGTLTNGAFMDVKNLQPKLAELTDTLKRQNSMRLGTNYDIGLETAYRLAYARRQANIANGEDREIVCIFMSDGAAMQYNYLSGRSQTEAWSQCIIGETDEILDPQNNADKYVITSDFGDTTVKQNPLLQEMLRRLAGLLAPVNDNGVIRSSLIKPGNGTQFYPAYTGNSTDFFEMMRSIGVECNWELLWQIAWKNYTVANGNVGYYNALNIPSLNLQRNDKFCENTMRGIIYHSLRKPSFDANGNQYEYQTLSPYYYFYNAEGKNWWAEALKGDVDKLYPVPSKFAYEDSTEWGEAASREFYYGDVRNNFSGVTTKDLALDGKDYIGGYRGLDVDLYTIGFSLGTENRIDYTEAAKVLENIATGLAYHFAAADGDELTSALNAITYTITSSAKRAYYTDTMGPNFDLSTEKTVVDEDGRVVTVNGNPTLRVLEYTLDKTKPLYDQDGNHISYERKKDANGNYMYIVREVITFTDLDGDGNTDAWSDQVYNMVTNSAGDQEKQYPDIWDESNNLITGKYVRYNASKTSTVAMKLDDSGRTFSLQPETFFWLIGTLGETEMVLEYQVYLEGSLQGDLSHLKTYYDTNKEAILYYVNYLGNDCHLDTVTPKFPWGDGISVSAQFYLVDENGNPLTSDGVSTDFSGSQKLGEEQFADVKPGANTLDASDLLTKAGLDPDLYELYDPSADYTLTYDVTNSGGTKWDITVGSGKKETTYVTNYGEGKDPTTETTSTGLSGVDYDATKVYFAVRYKQKATEDVIVIDFGLPVKINVLGNDKYAGNGATVLGIKLGSTVPANDPLAVPAGYVLNDTGSYGTVEVITQGADRYSILYTPNTMQMETEEKFVYAAQEVDTGYYYHASVTVIPAANIYYEDYFLSFTDSTVSNDSFGKWSAETSAGDHVQSEDRPGEDAADVLGDLDADNIYGYDPAYDSFTEYSLGAARHVTVDTSTGNYNNAPTAKFTFTGTGFDVVGLTDSTSGAITVEVKDEKGNVVVNYIVNNYYGMTFNTTTGKWEVAQDNDESCLYQVPVMKVEGLNYGEYHVTIRAVYMEFMDVESAGSYTIWLDAIRIYNPAMNNGTANDAYVQDGENNPHLTTVKKLLVKPSSFTSGANTSGVIYVDGKGKDVTIAEYIHQGPNNETYLQNNNGIAFKLRYKGTSEPSINLHVGAKLAIGSSATLNFNGNALTTLTTATNMFYKLGELDWTQNGEYWLSEPIVLSCSADINSILSITDLKVTGTDAAKIESLPSADLSVILDDAVVEAAKKYMAVNAVTLTGKGFSLSFEDEILVNFYYALSDVTNVTEQGMLVFHTNPGNADITLADQKYTAPVFAESTGLYGCTTTGIAAKEMGDSRYYCAYAKLSDGTVVYSDLYSYSPKQYAMSRLEKSADEDLKALCVAMLNYGAAAQNYFGYKTDALMNADLTAAQQALVGAYSADLFTGAVPVDPAKVDSYFTATETGFESINASVSFEGAFALNFYVQLDREDMEVDFYYWTKETYESVDTLMGSNATGSMCLMPDENGIFHAPITGIAAKELDDTIYVAAVYTIGGEFFCTGVIPYSLSTYCMKHAEGNMGALAQATAMYGYYAKAYFAN